MEAIETVERNATMSRDSDFCVALASKLKIVKNGEDASGSSRFWEELVRKTRLEEMSTEHFNPIDIPLMTSKMSFAPRRKRNQVRR